MIGLGIDGIEGATEWGRGGFAVVYRADQPAFDRPVAVKVLKVSTLDEKARYRFERECRAMGALSEHPGIATVYEAGFTADGRPYIIMPFLHHGNLLEQMRRTGPFTWQEATEIGVRLAGALEAAHQAGVIHRDVKPANVLRSRYGEPVLADFGIARVAGAPETASGELTATILHAAPEVLEGHRPDAPSDVYSLGSTLYNLIAGTPPFRFDRDTSIASMIGHILTNPPPDIRAHDVPEPVAAVIHRSLEKDPVLRPATAAAFGDELRAAQKELGLHPTPMLITGYEADRIADSSDLAKSVVLVPPGAATVVVTPTGPDKTATADATPTKFLGREAETAALIDLVTADRLVTMVGAGGTGKSSLARHVAEAVGDVFADGVWMADLSALVDPTLIPQEIAAAVGVSGRPGMEVLDLVLDRLAEAHGLLVLDGCGETAADCRDYATLLVEDCPQMHVLIAAEEPLGVAGETVWELPPLEIPRPEEIFSLAQLEKVESASLFIDRARSAAPGFKLDEGNAAAVSGICIMLGGLPLPLELAAAGLRSKTAPEIRASLQESLQDEHGSRAGLGAEQIVAGVHSRSLQLLTGEGRRLAEESALYGGGLTAAAAAALLGDIDAEAATEAAEEVAAAGLLVKTEGRDGAPRYLTPPALRPSAVARLDAAGHLEPARQRHAANVIEVVETVTDQPDTQGAFSWDVLEDENHNVRAALQWALDSGRVEIAERLGAALTWFWYWRNHFNEGTRWIDRITSAAPEGVTADRARLLFGAGVFAEAQGDVETARVRFEDSLAVSRGIGDQPLMVRALTGLGVLARDRGELERAADLLAESVAVARELDDKAGLCLALRLSAVVAYLRGDVDAAPGLLDEALTLARENHNLLDEAWTLQSLGWAHLDHGNFTEAADLLDDGLARFQELGDRRGMGWTLLAQATLSRYGGDITEAEERVNKAVGLFEEAVDRRGSGYAMVAAAAIARAMEKYDHASSLLKSSLAIFEDIGDRCGIAWARCGHGKTARRRFDHQTAVDDLQSAYRLFAESGEMWGLASAMGALGDEFLRVGRVSRGSRMLGAADQIRAHLDAPQGIIGLDSDVVQLLETQSPQEVALVRHWEEGRNMDVTTILETARAGKF